MTDTSIVREGYDAAITDYLAERDQLKSTPYVRKFLKLLARRSTVLDLGCGAGIPVDDVILDAGHDVVGIDISPAMIAAARINCPGATYDIRDIQSLTRGEYAVDGIVSLYTLFHVPRGQHLSLLRILRSYLPLGGPLLITMGDTDFEGTTPFYGHPMWWSQWGPDKNRGLIAQAGFEIVLDKISHTGAEHHHFLLARAC